MASLEKKMPFSGARLLKMDNSERRKELENQYVVKSPLFLSDLHSNENIWSRMNFKIDYDELKLLFLKMASLEEYSQRILENFEDDDQNISFMDSLQEIIDNYKNFNQTHQNQKINDLLLFLNNFVDDDLNDNKSKLQYLVKVKNQLLTLYSEIEEWIQRLTNFGILSNPLFSDFSKLSSSLKQHIDNSQFVPEFQKFIDSNFPQQNLDEEEDVVLSPEKRKSYVGEFIENYINTWISLEEEEEEGEEEEEEMDEKD